MSDTLSGGRRGGKSMEWLDSEERVERAAIEAGMVGTVVKVKAIPADGGLELIYTDGKVVRVRGLRGGFYGVRVQLITD